MITLRDIDRRIREHLARLRLAVEIVSDVVFNDDGTATAKGIGDHELKLFVVHRTGMYSRPLDSGGGVVVKPNGEGNTALLIGWKEVTSKSLQKGETIVYSEGGGQQLFDKDGNIKIDAKAAKDILLNGGNTKVALVANGVYIGSLSGTVPVGGGAVTFTFVPANADGTPNVPGTVVGASVTLGGKIDSAAGAARVKA